MSRFLLLLLALFNTRAAFADVTVPAGNRSSQSGENYNRFNIYKPRYIYLADGGSHTMRFSAPSTLADDSYNFILPGADGTNGQCLTTNGSQTLSWRSVFENPMTTTGDMIYSADNSGTPTRLVVGSAHQLIHGGVTPGYSAVDLALDVTGLLSLTTSVSGALPIANGGTGQVTANSALNALLPSQTGNSGKTLATNGTDASWVAPFSDPMTTTGDMIYSADNSGTPARLPIGSSTQVIHGGTTPSYAAVSLTADVSGALPIGNGGTGQTTKAPAFDALSPLSTAGDTLYYGGAGTGTRLPAGTSVQLLHSGTTPSWAAVSLTADVTGTLPAGNGGTGLTSLGSGVDTWLGTPSSANLATAVTDETGSGALVFGTAPTITLGNGTGLPLTTGVTGTLPIGNGGTGQTSANPAFNALSPMTTAGDIIYGGVSGAATRLAPNGAATVVLHGGTTPSWASVTLNSDVNGILPLVNGGTGVNAASANAAFNALAPSQTSNSGKFLTTDGTDTSWSAAALTNPMTTAGDIIYGQSSGTPSRLSAGTSVQLLHSGTTPSWAAVSLTADVSGTLPLGNGGTNATTKAGAFDSLSPMTTAGDIIFYGGAGTGTRLATGTSTQVLHSGTTPSYSQIVDADVSSSAAIAGSKLVAAASGVAGAVSTGTQTVTGAKTFETQLIGKGTATNDAAAAGYIGEVISASGSSNTLNAAVNITSIVLSAGDWLIMSNVTGDSLSGVALVSDYMAMRVTTSSTPNVSSGTMCVDRLQSSASTSGRGAAMNLPFTASISGSTTYYLHAVYSTGLTTGIVYGAMIARRLR